MLYRCINPNCPHFCPPCEMTESEYLGCTKTTPCPIGEADYFYQCNEEKEFFCLIVGSRSFTDYLTFRKCVDHLLQKKLKKEIVIVTGGADGTDTMAERYAKEKKYQLLVMKADWESGKKAGYERNERMHAFISEKQDKGVIAFWDGKSNGTHHSFELARRYGNQIKIISTEK